SHFKNFTSFLYKSLPSFVSIFACIFKKLFMIQKCPLPAITYAKEYGLHCIRKRCQIQHYYLNNKKLLKIWFFNFRLLKGVKNVQQASIFIGDSTCLLIRESLHAVHLYLFSLQAPYLQQANGFYFPVYSSIPPISFRFFQYSFSSWFLPVLVSIRSFPLSR